MSCPSCGNETPAPCTQCGTACTVEASNAQNQESSQDFPEKTVDYNDPALKKAFQLGTAVLATLALFLSLGLL